MQGVGYRRFDIVEGLALRKIRQPRLPSGGEPDERNISLRCAFFQGLSSPRPFFVVAMTSGLTAGGQLKFLALRYPRRRNASQ